MVIAMTKTAYSLQLNDVHILHVTSPANYPAPVLPRPWLRQAIAAALRQWLW